MSATAACPKCDPCNPELDEDGRPYACYFCGDSGTVDKASADAYWQDATDAAEYRGMLPVVEGKHHLPRYDQESGDCYTVISTLLPGACFPRAPHPFPRVHVGYGYSNGIDDAVPF